MNCLSTSALVTTMFFFPTESPITLRNLGFQNACGGCDCQYFKMSAYQCNEGGLT